MKVRLYQDVTRGNMAMKGLTVVIEASGFNGVLTGKLNRNNAVILPTSKIVLLYF